MTVTSYIFGIAASILILIIVIEMLRRRRLRERHAAWWLFAGTMALLIGIFPQTLRWAAALIGIQVPTNLVFFVSLAILFLVCLQHSAELTDLESHNRALAEAVVLQDLRIRELEATVQRQSPPTADDSGPSAQESS
ncbi:MAG: DUF2304 domain-containing protein [Microbacteriaceae bacterium]|nr:MAG: DUF2304 domain-containing protein [Microbacteriaceae bacterium]